MFFRIWKICIPPLPLSNLLSTPLPQYWYIFDASTYVKLLSPSPNLRIVPGLPIPVPSLLDHPAILETEKTKRGFKWPTIIMVQYWSRCTTRCILGWRVYPRLFLIYINDLLDGFTTNASLFADYVSLFSVFDNMNLSVNNLKSWTVTSAK